MKGGALGFEAALQARALGVKQGRLVGSPLALHAAGPFQKPTLTATHAVAFALPLLLLLLLRPADTLAAGVARTSSLLGTGTPSQPGTLAAAAGAVHAAPQAVQEFDQQVVLPVVKDFAEGVVTVAKDAQVQVGVGPHSRVLQAALHSLFVAVGGFVCRSITATA